MRIASITYLLYNIRYYPDANAKEAPLIIPILLAIAGAMLVVGGLATFDPRRYSTELPPPITAILIGILLLTGAWLGSRGPLDYILPGAILLLVVLSVYRLVSRRPRWIRRRV
jgi:hypothetical protein